jgi:phosphoglucomutase
LLAAEITAVLASIPGALRRAHRQFGAPVFERIDAPAAADQRRILQTLRPRSMRKSRGEVQVDPDHSARQWW